MSKIYKGWELMKAIADGEIEERTRFKANYETFMARDGYLFKEDSDKQEYATSFELNWDFKLIEDEIDIDNIEEYKQEHTERCIDVDIRNKINELIQAVKQLDKRVKEMNTNEKS